MRVAVLFYYKNALVPLDKFKKELDSELVKSYSDYESMQIGTSNIMFMANTDPDMPTGQVAKISGIIKYKDGSTARFLATLQREDEAWRIWGINVSRSIGGD